MPQLGDLFPKTLADIVTKSQDEVSIDAGAGGAELPDGSYERTIGMVNGPVRRAVPCPSATSDWGGDSDGTYHYPSVVGTFPDHAIVGCDGCDRFWKVPYEVTSDDGRANVKVGDPEARVRAYMAPAAAVDALNDPPFEAKDEPGTAEPTPSLPEPSGSEA